jgi:large repetitive protein
LPLAGSAPPTLVGGDGTYSYLWQRFEGGSWNSAPGVNTEQNYTFTASLTTVGNNLYMRNVVSGACANNSETLTITVLSAIAGNLLTPVDSLCIDTEIKIGGPVPTAGGTGSYSYSWERKFESTSFGTFGTGGPAADSILTGELNQDAYFRRTVTSGPCLHVSNEKAVRIDSRPGSTILTRDTLLFFKREFDISASIPDKGVGKWEVVQPTHGYQITNPNAVTTRITNLNIDDVETRHRVLWKVSYLNCADTSSLSITTRGLFKPNAFSPNGDNG